MTRGDKKNVGALNSNQNTDADLYEAKKLISYLTLLKNLTHKISSLLKLIR